MWLKGHKHTNTDMYVYVINSKDSEKYETKYDVAYLGNRVLHARLWLLVLQDKHIPLQVDLNHKEMDRLSCVKTDPSGQKAYGVMDAQY